MDVTLVSIFVQFCMIKFFVVGKSELQKAQRMAVCLQNVFNSSSESFNFKIINLMRLTTKHFHKINTVSNHINMIVDTRLE